MFKITRHSDYAIVLLTHMAREAEKNVCTARDLAAEAQLPRPTVSKILKVLARKNLLTSHRGSKGGYSLGRRPEQITLRDVLTAMEGPVAITECSVDAGCTCKLELTCLTRSNWQRINRAVRAALGGITLLEMTLPLPEMLVTLGGESDTK